MSIRSVFKDKLAVRHYEDEVWKIIEIGCVEHAVLYYQYAAYYYKVLNKPFISKELFEQLCDFIVDNAERLNETVRTHVNLDDIALHTCSLTVATPSDTYQKGKNFLVSLMQLLRQREDTFDIDYKVSRWEEPVAGNN